MRFQTVLALIAGFVAFALLLVVTSVTGATFFFGNTSLWALLYVIGIPLVGALLVVRRFK